MTHGFDRGYWDRHWQEAGGAPGAVDAASPNPYLVRAAGGLAPGTALDAGCGTGAEAVWLATQGWRVTAADVAADALARAARRAADSGVEGRVTWVEADLTVWSPDTQFDLVTTHYAHAAMAQLELYRRIAAWVVPGGTLLVVGHRATPDGTPDRHHGQHGHHGEHGQHPPAEASVTVADVTGGLDDDTWEIVTAAEPVRTLTGPGRDGIPLHDVVVQATRRH